MHWAPINFQKFLKNDFQLVLLPFQNKCKKKRIGEIFYATMRVANDWFYTSLGWF